MPERVTANRVADFVECLQKLGGASGNGRLRDALKWEEEFYWKVQGKLIEEGRIRSRPRPGRFRQTNGGRVRASSGRRRWRCPTFRRRSRKGARTEGFERNSGWSAPPKTN